MEFYQLLRCRSPLCKVAWVDLVVVKTSEEITKTSVEVAEAVAILVITLTEEPEEEAVVI